MTAPTRTRRKPPVETPSRTGKAAPERRHTRAGQQRTTAAERAYARRAQRVDLLRSNEKEPRREGRKLRLRWPKSRASFVLIVMTLLAAGVVATLLLSTQAIADSYRLEQIREENGNLAEQSEQLQQDVTKAESASSLANRAKALGMVPGGNPAHLVQNPDGSITVVGVPTKAAGQAPPSTPVSTPPPANSAGTAPIEGDVAQGDQQQPPVVSAQAGGQ
jgi:hypothetical protein